MNEVSEERRLFREAIDLAIRLQNDPGNPIAIEMIRSWAARSPKHEAAWARVAEIHGMTGRILAEEKRASRQAQTMISRRRLMVGGTIGLGAVAAGSWLGPGLLQLARADYRTTTAEISDVELPDGTAMTLGPNSAVALGYSDEYRAVDLLAGMAYFQVASEPARPFFVRSGSTTAVALGTAFDISSDADFVSVSVDHGVVEVRAADTGTTAVETISAGEWLTVDPSSAGMVRGTRDASQIAAWRSGMIVAEQEHVAALIARIGRWHSGMIVTADPSVGERLVSGVFDLSDPARALEAVVRPFGAKVHQVAPFLTLISPV